MGSAPCTRVVPKVEAASTRALFADLDWHVVFHPPYCPDLVPSDFHLFTHLKQFKDSTVPSDFHLFTHLKRFKNGTVPSDFHLFKHLKRFKDGMRMGNDEQVKQRVEEWFNGLEADF
jgi:hypothetical protein